jgi:hypothetical protein
LQLADDEHACRLDGLGAFVQRAPGTLVGVEFDDEAAVVGEPLGLSEALDASNAGYEAVAVSSSAPVP